MDNFRTIVQAHEEIQAVQEFKIDQIEAKTWENGKIEQFAQFTVSGCSPAFVGKLVSFLTIEMPGIIEKVKALDAEQFVKDQAQYYADLEAELAAAKADGKI
jgi:hypothetical protein